MTSAFIPFDTIREDQFIPSLEKEIKKFKEGLEKIKSNPSSANFLNTIEALEFLYKDINALSNLFHGLLSVKMSESMQNIAQAFSPMLTSLESDVLMDHALFERVKVVSEAGLNAEEKMLLHKTYRAFELSGAQLDEDKKAELKSINQELSTKCLDFGNNQVKAMEKFIHIPLSRKAEVEGVVETILTSAENLAKKKNLDGYCFQLNMPTYSMVMKSAKNENLRKEMYLNMGKMCYRDEFDNTPLVRDIVRLRIRKAKLLGFETYAHLVLEERMAKKPEVVMNFLEDFREKSLDIAKSDLEKLKKLKGAGEDFYPWDFSYYAELLKLQELNFNDELLRPYLELNNAIKGLFFTFQKLYGLQFKLKSDLPVYHPDVQVYEVLEENGNFIGRVILDLFSRSEKMGGAWMNDYRKSDPIVGVHCNYHQPVDKQEKILLDFRDIETLFHEFGHAMHGLLAKGKYESLLGTSVYWDFVELPSQIMENFVFEDEVMNQYAIHHQTKEKLPQELKTKLIKGRSFLEGYATLRQTSLGITDMAWHYNLKNEKDVEQIDVEKYEKEATKKLTLMKPIEGVCFSTTFGHIFQGGYASGYYSYKWAEVLEADLFHYFLENKQGKKDKINWALGREFREKILAPGGSVDPMELFVNFRGRKPEVKFLLERAFN